jgi:hypothetical protein
LGAGMAAWWGESPVCVDEEEEEVEEEEDEGGDVHRMHRMQGWWGLPRCS